MQKCDPAVAGQISSHFFKFFIGILVLSQVVFAFYAPIYMREQHTAQLFATIGIRYDGTDLHKLNEGAHYFGQTIIGWTKFPNFMPEAIAFASLPEGSTVIAHMQERQNLIFEIQSPAPVKPETVQKVRQFIDQKLSAYNHVANVRIELANVDFQITDEKRSYLQGALIALGIGLIAAAATAISRNI